MDSAPLEKQLLHLQLGKGVNERDRPETADPVTCLTRVENLVQDQAGAYIKRPGISSLGTLTDIGTTLTTPSKILRTTDGLACIANTNSLYQYQEGIGSFRFKGKLPGFVVDSVDDVTSSGSVVNPTAESVATSTDYHAVVVSRNIATLGSVVDNWLSIFDRSTGEVVASYNLTVCTGGSVSPSGFAPKIIFAQDRYLHVLCQTSIGGIYKVVGFVIDTGSPLPESSADIAATVTVVSSVALNYAPYDVATYGAYVYVSYDNATNMCIARLSATSGAVLETCTVGAFNGTTFLSVSGTNLWYTVNARIGAKSVSLLATQTVTEAASGASSIASLCVTDGYAYITVPSGSVTFGSTTLGSVLVWKASVVNTTTCTLSSTIVGWRAMSHPFSSNGRTYLHVSKTVTAASSVVDISPNIVVDVTGAATITLDAHSYSNVIPAAYLEVNVGTNVNTSTILRYLSQDASGTSSRISALVAIQTASRGMGYSFVNLSPNRYDSIEISEIGGVNYLSGGAPVMYDGDCASEAGFCDYPLMNVQEGAAGSIVAGLYNYVSVYRFVDSTGAITFSRSSTVSSVVLGASKKANVTVSPCTVTSKDHTLETGSLAPDQKSTVEVYRTLVGGTQYYLCASSQALTPLTGLLTQPLPLAATGFFLVADNLTDAQLATQPLMYRQPGTVNTPLDRYPPPACKHMVQHNDRLFVANGNKVSYSSFFVDGEAAWFNPNFSFHVHGGHGKITGLMSMDGRLFIFKRNAVFVVDGDGPPEAGPAGNEFSSPRRIASEYGCIDSRCLIRTTEGIVYRSWRGIELLTRSLAVKWVGAVIQNTVNANPHTCGTTLDSFGRVHILLAESDPNNAVTINGIDGVGLVWDIPSDAWTLSYFTGSSGVYGGAMQDICAADLAGYGETLVYADPAAGIMYGDETVSIDKALYYVPWVIETAWIRNGQQSRQRVSEVLLLAKKNAGANHAVRISLAYNYVDSYTQTFTWQPGDLATLAIEELSVSPTTQSVIAVRIKIEEIEPSVTNPTTGFTAQLGTVLSYLSNIELGQYVPISYPVGTGRGCDVLGITVEIAPKKGTPKLSSGQKA